MIPETEAAAESVGIATVGVIETGVGEVAVVTEVTAATKGAVDLHLQDPSTARTTDAM